MSSQREQVDAVVVGRDGAFCVIEPSCPALSEAIYTVRHEPSPSRQHGVRVVRRPFPLVWQQRDPAGNLISVGFAGQERLIVAKLKQLGVEIQKVKRPGKILPPPAYIPRDSFLEIDETLLTLVQNHEQGWVRYDSGRVDPARLIAQIALGWKRSTFLIAVTRAKDAWKLRDALSNYLSPDQIGVYTSGHSSPETKRIAIGCYEQLGQGVVEIERREILIALNPVDLVANKYGRDTIRLAKAARFYGLHPTDQGLGPFHQDLLEGERCIHGVLGGVVA